MSMAIFKNIHIFLLAILFYTTTNAQTSGIEALMKRSHELLMKETLHAGCEYIPSQTYVLKINSYACVKNAVICNATLKCAYSKNNIVTEYEERANCATDSNGKCPAKADDCRKDQKVHEIYRGPNAITTTSVNASSSSSSGLNTSSPQPANTQSGIK